ncbi:MAG: carboxylesterase family protein, partial [Rhodobiaceae bacterium]|nr:carboxylesterase family protein [Rhodobiaceae bacterium]
MRHILRSGILAAIVITCPLASAAQAAPEVTLSQGTLGGVEGDGYIQFKGVRYAEPPVGERRWMPPAPVAAHLGPVDATASGAGCAQGPSPWGSPSTVEDCLFLDITVPGAANAMGFWQNKPVMVWFHGGGFTGGSGDVYDARALATENDVIVVTINYRLGAFGNFAHPALDAEGHLAANYGLMDQQQALRWVRANIAAFGGNPTNVTVFGESAGAIAIYAHLVSPLAAGLFQRAIIESGAPADITLEKAEEIGIGVAEALGCPGDATPAAAACLRALPVDQLLAKQVTPIATFIDGTLLPAPIEQLLDEGRFHAVPVMNGTNHDEGNLIAAFMFDLSGEPLEARDFEKAVGIIGGFIPRVGYPSASHGAVEAIYDPAKYDSPGLAAAQIITDGVIACPALKSSRTMAAHGAPVFEYEMADIDAPSIVAGPVSFPHRAGHFSELQYLFDLSSIT